MRALEADLLLALKRVVAVSDRKTDEYDFAHAVIARAEKILGPFGEETDPNKWDMERLS